MYNYNNGKDYYFLDKWSKIKKPNQIENWVWQLKRGIKLGKDRRLPVCSWDLDNLQWSGEVLQNSISISLCRQTERDLDDHATGPEVFKVILMKYRHLNASTIRKMDQ